MADKIEEQEDSGVTESAELDETGEQEEFAAANDAQAMLDIIKEKDKIIVSLKESSTQRDKINENQINLLSVDNQKKLGRINELMSAVQRLEKAVAEREAKLSLVDERHSSHGVRLEQLKVAVDEYKENISRSMGEIRDMVTRELRERDERGEGILERMRENQGKLEGKLSEAEQHYKNIIQGIAEKQVKTRLFIRKALVDLQEALSQLDLNTSQAILDSRLTNEFSDIMAQSDELAGEYRSRSHDAATIIHNIENVHIQLASTPKLDSFFDHLADTAQADAAQKEEDAPPEEKEELPLSQEGQDELSQLLEDAWSKADQPPPQPPQMPPYPDSGPRAAYAPPAPQYAPPAPQYAPQYAPPVPQYAPPPAPQQAPPSPQMRSAAGPPAMVMAMPAPPQEQSFKTEEDLILRESPNLAPYNWDMLPISSPLLHFRHMLNNAKKAEHQRNFLKAISIYQAVMQQRTIQENDLARNILKDQLEALDRLARSQISINPKRKDIERYFNSDKKDDH